MTFGCRPGRIAITADFASPESAAALAEDVLRARLARAVYGAVFEAADAFELANVGADLAYLLGAILEGSECAWPRDRPLLVHLRGRLGADHPVWDHVVLDDPEDPED